MRSSIYWLLERVQERLGAVLKYRPCVRNSLGFILVLFVYLWFSFDGKPVRLDASPRSFYGLLSDGLLAGHLYLSEEPNPALLALPDPYDPAQNRPYRLHDASLYHGHWYLYFGVTPALLAGIPLRLMGLGVHDSFCVAVFSWIAFLAAMSFLRVVARGCGLSPPDWMWVLTALALAFSHAIPLLLTRCAVYETAVSCGYCCTVLALYFLSSGILGEHVSTWRLALGSLFLALAVGARPNLFFHGWLMLLVSRHLWRVVSIQQRKRQVLAVFWFPYVAVGICLALYNYARFGSLTEFGLSYQLPGINIKQIRMFDLGFIMPNFYYYIWSPFKMDANMPFFHMSCACPVQLPADYVGVDAMVGVLASTPLLYLLALCPMVSEVQEMRTNRSPLRVRFCLGVLMLLGFTQLIFLCYTMPGAAMRYSHDFAPHFLLAALLVWFALADRLLLTGALGARRCLNVLAAGMIVYGSVCNLAIAAL